MEKCELLIENTMVLEDSAVLLKNTDIAMAEGRIVETGRGLKEKYQAELVWNGKNKLFMPGLTDSHMHTGQQLLKGQVLDAKPIIWTRIMLPFESTMTPEKMKLSAALAALEMIKSGTSSFVEAGSYCMEEAAEIYSKSGLRGALSFSTMDEEGLPETIAMTAEAAVKRTDALYDGFHGKGNLKVYYSLRALNSCSEKLICLAAQRARDKGTMLQAHMNEYMGEIHGILEREGLVPYEYLEKLGVLGKNFLGAHSLILTRTEKEILQERGVKICHCPFSNCGKAVPDTPELLAKGISVGMGTDGAAHGGLSLWNEMKIFRSVMNIYHGVPKKNPKVMPAEAILSMVLEGGAAAVQEEGQLGKLKAGYKADMIGIDLNQPHLAASGNMIHTLLESVNAGDVIDMIVGGKVLMKDREVQVLDEERLLYEARKYGEAV